MGFWWFVVVVAGERFITGAFGGKAPIYKVYTRYIHSLPRYPPILGPFPVLLPHLQLCHLRNPKTPYSTMAVALVPLVSLAVANESIYRHFGAHFILILFIFVEYVDKYFIYLHTHSTIHVMGGGHFGLRHLLNNIVLRGSINDGRTKFGSDSQNLLTRWHYYKYSERVMHNLLLNGSTLQTTEVYILVCIIFVIKNGRLVCFLYKLRNESS